MTTAKRIEHQITRQLLQRREASALPRGAVCADMNTWVDRLIAILAVAAGLLILGSYLEELLWAAVAATTILTLR